MKQNVCAAIICSCAALLLCAAQPVAATGSNNAPNVLFIAVDDLRPMLGCYGNTNVISPHIDSIADRGVLFNRAYVTYPLCLPSRAAMLTGIRIDWKSLPSGEDRFPDLVEGRTLWPNVFRQSNYWTAVTGKIEHGNPVSGTEAWDVPGEKWPGGNYANPEVVTNVVAEGGRPDQMPSNGATINAGSLVWQEINGPDSILGDGRTADVAIGYITNRPPNQPFVIAVGFHRPHLPWCAPKPYFDMYPPVVGSIAEPPEGFLRELNPEDPTTSNTEFGWNEGLSDEESLKLIRAYMACTTYVDAQVGRLLAVLDQEGLTDNTIIVVWGDHGYHLTDHGFWRKNRIYHIANRIPFIIVAPGYSEGEICPRVVETIDIYPTLMELCGLQGPDVLDGHSLVPLLENPAQPWHDVAYISANGGYGLVDPQYRFSLAQDTLKPALFDLQADPEEWHNLATNANYAGLVDTLTQRVFLGWKKAGGPGSLVEDFLGGPFATNNANFYNALSGTEFIRQSGATGYGWGGWAPVSTGTVGQVKFHGNTSTLTFTSLVRQPGSYAYTIFSTNGNGVATDHVPDLQTISVNMSKADTGQNVGLLIKDARGDWYLSTSTTAVGLNSNMVYDIDVSSLDWEQVNDPAAAEMDAMDSPDTGPGMLTTDFSSTSPDLSRVYGGGIYLHAVTVPDTGTTRINSIGWRGTYPDADGDSIPDLWETRYFGRAIDAVAAADTDNDGQDNLAEYISGFDPTNPASLFEITDFIAATTGSPGFEVEWNSVSGRVYRIGWAQAMTNAFTNLQDGIPYPQSSYTDLVNGAEDSGFYRIDVRLQNP